MKKIVFLIIAIINSISIADAAVRDINSPKRTGTTQTTLSSRQSGTQSRPDTTSARTAKNKTIQSRASNTTAKKVAHRTSSQKQTSTQSVLPRTQTTQQKNTTTTYRAASTLTTPASNTFNTGYATCREAYFTCMDQFCGALDDTYRRCICSSKLTEIQSRERALKQTSEQIEDFKTFNLYAIDKTTAEVNAMVSASAGESAQENATDKSDSAAALSTITDVLSKTTSQSNQNQPDFSANINVSWDTSGLIGGTNIANLTGDALYNTVNAQCLQLISSSCPNETTVQMVTSAYGMYIENDCSLLISNLDSKKKSTNSEIRKTENDMGSARLDNYNAHNSTGINDCIAKIRQDLTTNMACGPNYIHCLDITGKYLNYQTGEPIYSPDFYELNNATSLTGDILKNNTNNMLIANLNDKKIFAERSLDTCRDLSDEIWDDFLRQAITEIHQEQQKRIRDVKNECLSVVVSCYNTQNEQLIDFSNIDAQKLLGARLELSEEMCQEKLTACSNLYGGGPNGMQELTNAMYNIVSEHVANNCYETLEQFASTLCSPSKYEVEYSFPFDCRTYAPGNEICATMSDDYSEDTTNCSDYNGSLYHKFAQYALEMCIRPSKAENGLTASVLQDINAVMNNVRTQMYQVLTTECEKQDGQWLQYTNNPMNTRTKNMKFYSKTPAHDKWGTCVEK